jgi:peptidoglycan/xylan/chitin deacetylase (PgdA/CDA1 family)
VGIVGPGLLALTFDDGPDSRGTPAVLEALAEAGVTATFFVLGERVVAEPQLLARVVDGGHAVELHGYAHLRHPESPRAVVEADLVAAIEALRAHGLAPARWRVPWGHLADYSRALADAHGLTLAGWTLDSHDWRGDAADAMLASLVPGLARGAIALLHDGIGVGARRSDAGATAALVGPLVRAARARGLAPGPLVAPWPAELPVGNPDFA